MARPLAIVLSSTSFLAALAAKAGCLTPGEVGAPGASLPTAGWTAGRFAGVATGTFEVPPGPPPSLSLLGFSRSRRTAGSALAR